VHDYRRGLDGMIRFIDLYTQLGITSNYSAIGNLHTSHFTTAPAKPSLAYCVFTSRSLTRGSKSGDFSTFRAQVLPSPTIFRDFLPAIPSTKLDRYHFLSLTCRPQLYSALPNLIPHLL
jgi:hypothetical protein